MTYRNKKILKKMNDQSGFTIVELMIATVVSSIILIVITFGIVYFTNSYYKGINASTTQATTQNAIDVITQAIQFNATQTTPTVTGTNYFCAGNQVFLYTLGKQFDGTPSSSNWGLYQLTNQKATCVMPTGAALNNGTELISKNMRLTYLNLAQIGSSNVWRLDVRASYGAPDLLCSTSVTGTSKGSCQKGAIEYTSGDIVAGSDVVCKAQTGSQFCSSVHLTTAIGQRIVN